MRIYLEIETKKRELDSRIYFAIKAAKNGYSTVFGKKSRLIENLDRMTPGVFILKSGNKRAAQMSKKLKDKNFIPFASDEEGSIILNYKETGKRVSKDCLETVENFFSWGGDEKNAILKNHEGYTDKIIEVGNCRMDILKDPIRNIYMEEAQKIKKKYGSFILYTSGFHKYNAILEDNSNSWQEYMIARGEIKNISKNFIDIVKFQGINMQKTINFFKEYSKSNIDKLIIIRPHPAENFENWKKEIKNLKNVKLVYDDLNTNSWILASDMVLAYNCTTLLEAYLLGKIPINLVFEQSELTKFKLSYLVSKKVDTSNEMLKIIKNYNNKSYINLDRTKIDTKLSNIILNTSNNCAADNICKFLKNKNYNNIFNKKDKFSNKISFFYFYLKIQIKNLIYRSTNKNLNILSKQKNPGISYLEVKEKVNKIAHLAQVNNVICNELYPGLFLIKKK